jgi:hypothetical protein
MLAVTPTLSHAATGSVRITISRTGFIFGGGSATPHFQAKRYSLRVGGVSVGPFGAPQVDLVGRAYHMRTAAMEGLTPRREQLLQTRHCFFNASHNRATASSAVA